MKKSFGGIILTLTTMAVLTGCNGGSTAAPAGDTAKSTEAATTVAVTKAPDGKFIVGFDQDFPPMGFVGEDGQYTGFDLELAQEVAKRLELEFVAQPIAWDAKDMELESGTIDCIWNGFTINGREDKYTWTKPYMDNKQIFMVSKDSGIKTQADLAGKVVEVQTDSSAEAALKDMSDLTSTFGTFQKTPDYNTAFMDLEMGAVDAIAMDVVVAGYQLSVRGDDKYEMLTEEPIANEEYGVGFKLGNTELRDKVQKTLEEMAADGTMKSISEKWFQVDLTTIGK